MNDELYDELEKTATKAFDESVQHPLLKILFKAEKNGDAKWVKKQQ